METSKPIFQAVNKFELSNKKEKLEKLLEDPKITSKDLVCYLLSCSKRKQKNNEKKGEKVSDIFEAIGNCVKKFANYKNTLFNVLEESGVWICKQPGYLCLSCGSSLNKTNLTKHPCIFKKKAHIYYCHISTGFSIFVKDGEFYKLIGETKEKLVVGGKK
jgi:hypothetical protein